MFIEKLKATTLIILFFSFLIFIAYWAVKSLQVDPEEFDKTHIDVRPMVVNGPDEGTSISEVGDSSNEEVVKEAEIPTEPTNQPEKTNTGLFDELKSQIQDLINNNVLMKRGSRGTRVGTIQEFLNIYSGTDSKIDNDFGGTTENQIKAFQKKEGLSVDGQTGPSTYKKMIEWLNKKE